MNKIQKVIFNNGERLVPYISHDDVELVRHRSSYCFFHAVIASDLEHSMAPCDNVSVVDLGFGSGYGCALLSSLPGSQIIGVDISEDCEIFAKQYYFRSNVSYEIHDLANYIPTAKASDYVVSRGVLEHVPDGLNLVGLIKFRRRAMIDVPYDEVQGNEHHVLTGIKEDAFAGLSHCEFFYEDTEGRIFDAKNKPLNTNMLMVVISSPEMPTVSSMLEFPIEPVRDTKLEALSGVNAIGRQYRYDSAPQLAAAVERAIRETEVVIDIGCGILPMNYFRPKIHFLIEPWVEYSDILTYRYAGDKSVTVLRAGAYEALRMFGTNSADSIFLLDVIEHLDKDVGLKVLAECERVARGQIVVFTPLGYMPQEMAIGEPDAWGLGGRTVQEHKSGWEPVDFDENWTFYVCENYHTTNFRGEPLADSYGAFYAIRNFEGKNLNDLERLPDIRRPLPSELELNALRGKYQALSISYEALLRSPSVTFTRWLKRILRSGKRIIWR